MKKSILITGASQGIGYETAKTLHQNPNYQVFAGVRRSEDYDRLHQEGLHCLYLDVNHSDSIQAAVQQIKTLSDGKLYALINNAGFIQPAAMADATRPMLQKQFDTNVFGLVELTNACLPLLKQEKSARIINISSVLGQFCLPYRGVYCASKFAVEAIGDAYRMELQPFGIQVITINPGPVVTNLRERGKEAFAQVALDKSDYQSAYKKMETYFARGEETAPFAKQPRDVTRQIIKALEKKSPRTHYYTDIGTLSLCLLKCVLPTRAFDAIVSRFT